MTPQEPKGEQAGANAQVQVCQRLLEKAMQVYPSDTPQGKAILECLLKLNKAFGKGQDKAEAVMPAELKAALMGPGGEDAGGGAPSAAAQGGPGGPAG